MQPRAMLASSRGVQTPGTIQALTSLRFFAALFVVFYHLWGEFLPAAPAGIVARFIGTGFVSVSFFFLLSGYILAIVYLGRGATVPLRSFYLARLARVYPLYFLTLLLDTPHFFLILRQTFALKPAVVSLAIRFAANALMLQAWFPSLRGIDNPNWSLSVEAVLYLLFPFVGIALWKLRGMALWATALSFYLGGQLLVLMVVPHVSPTAGKFLPILHISTFVVGILVARWQTVCLQQGAVNTKLAGWKSGAMLACALAGFGTVVFWLPRIPITNLYDGLLAPVFLCLICAFSVSTWFPARVLSTPWLVALGEASFGLYLFHIPIFHIFEGLAWTHKAAVFPVYLVFTISVSVASFHWFETPMRRWILSRSRPVSVTGNIDTISGASKTGDPISLARS